MKNALSRSDKYRETGGERGPEEEAPTDGVVYLPAGHIQLGEVAAVRFRLSNTGSLGTAYRLFPVTPEELQEHLEPESPSSQQSEQPNETTNSVQDLAELPARNQNTEETATLNSVDAQPTEIQEKDSIFGQAEEDTRSFNASGWLEALQGEAVVLAQRLRISDKHNTFAWAKIVSSGLSKLLGKKKEQASREASCPETTFQLSLRSTLVKNAAGELDALQTQEITIVHAPTRTGRFVGFFALQFSNKEVLFHLRIASKYKAVQLWKSLIRVFSTRLDIRLGTRLAPEFSVGHLHFRSFCEQHDDVIVVVDGQCILPPVCMDAPLHDLGICVPNRVYRQHFQVTSNSSLTRTLQVVSPEAEEGVLWVEPRCSFVQPRGVASLTAHVCLSFPFFDRHPEYVQPLSPVIAKTNLKAIAFKIPIQIKASDQILCAETAITGTLTELHLRLSRTTLNFGTSDNTTRRMQLMRVHNPSLLIASYGFRSSDRALRVLEPPQFSDICGGTEKQLSTKTHQDSFSAAGAVSTFLSQDLSNGAAASREPSAKEEDPTSKRICGSVIVPAEGGREMPLSFLAPEEWKGENNRTWDDLHQYLPHIDYGGTGVLLPGETRTFAVVLDPAKLRCDAHALQLATGKAVEREGVLRLRVLLASQAAYEVKIPWAITFVECPISILPSPTLKFPAIPLGQRSTATLELKLSVSSLAPGRGEIEGGQNHARFPETTKQAAQSMAILVDVQQPPSRLSCLSITPTRILMDFKKRCASIFVCFTPTNEYMKMHHFWPITPVQEKEDDIKKSLVTSIVIESTKLASAKKVQSNKGGVREEKAQVASTAGAAKGREGVKKTSKTEVNTPPDTKNTMEKSLTHGEAKAKQSRLNSRPVMNNGDEGDSSTTLAVEESAEGAGNDARPATATSNAANAAETLCTLDRTCGRNISEVLLEVARAGGARWTSLEEDGGGDLFAFVNPRAYHHARWLIPLKIYRLTAKQVDAFLSGEELVSSQLPISPTAESFIEVRFSNTEFATFCH
ncbi:Flagellar associated protein, related, related [Eimeria necatrix]|uniref:Flagellar associated protein, related, related n=1 Tax=Eimeria necatrix TaxID=51315 RepID=U6MRA5_9EIME|nr:Flagellar associated protein, related, related [Eimeria necatrix]CDJ64190.1 Flagellar associated protein, related, related [Eimeria necatrix]